MNARIYKQTTTTQEKPEKTISKQPKQKEEEVSKQKPQKLPTNPKVTVATPKPRAHARQSKSSTHVEVPKGGKNNLQRIALKGALKVPKTSTLGNPRMGSNNVGSPRQISLGKGAPALSGRTATNARVGATDPTVIQARLKKKSPWFSSIMEPIKGGGTKIPDPIGTDTGTYQHVENVSVSVNAQGIAGLRVVSPYCNNYHFGGADDDGTNYQLTSSASTTSNLLWGSQAVPGQGGYPFAHIPAIMKANAQSHRIVSSSVIAQPEVSTLSDAGEMCAFVKPFDCNDSTVPYSTLQSQWDSSLMPVNQHKPQIARWYPLSSDYEIFNTITTVQDGSNEPSTISYTDFIDPNYHTTDEVALTGVIPWEYGVVCTGMTPSTGVVRFQIVVNYEFIPQTQTSMIPSDPSPIDPTEEQLVASWVSDCPITGPVSVKQAASPPMASTVSERSEPSGFGMLFNVVEEMMPLIKTGMSLL